MIHTIGIHFYQAVQAVLPVPHEALRGCPTQPCSYLPQKAVITGFCSHRLDQRIHLFFRHKFCKGRFYTSVFLDRNISESFCAVIFHKCRQFINLLSRHPALTFRVDTAYTSAISTAPVIRKAAVFTTSVTSVSSMPKRRSGLSEPNDPSLPAMSFSGSEAVHLRRELL